MGARVRWLDRAIGYIYNCRDHLILSQREEQLETRLVELQEETRSVQRLLEGVRAKRSSKNLCPDSVNNIRLNYN